MVKVQKFWQDAYDLSEETQTTSASMGYTASIDGSVEQEAAYEATVENFGTAFAANYTEFSNLTEANKNLVPMCRQVYKI